MLNSKQEIIEMANGIDIKGLDEVPIIIQGRPLFDFGSTDPELLKSLGQNEDDMFQADGLFNIAVFGDGRVEGLKTVSKQYQVVQHLDAIKNTLQALPEEFDLKGIKISVSPNGGKCFATFESGNSIEIKPGDNITYQLLMENSGDASTRFSLSGGAWRLVCSNGMKIPDSRVEQVTRKKLHKADLSLEGEIQEFLGIMNASIESMGAWKEYTKKKVGTPELESLFTMMEAGPRVQEEILDLTLRGENTSVRYLLEKKELSSWDLYNAFSQRITDSDSMESVKVERGNKVSQIFDRFTFN